MSRARKLALVLALPSAAALSTAALAQGEYLVQDLGQAPQASAADLMRLPFFAELDGVAYFYVDDGTHGRELWRSDGTAAGTYLVRDVCPGICGSEQFYTRQPHAAVGSLVYFSGNDGVHGSELWVTNGTASGTRLVADVNPGPHSSEPSPLHDAEGKLLFLADDGVLGRRLWSSDGTASGTQLLFDPEVDPLENAVQSITSSHGLVFLYLGNRELWRTDGSPAGTFRIHPLIGFPTGFEFQGAHRFLPDGTLVFQGCESRTGQMDCELWRTDGTLAGTTRVADLDPGPDSSSAGGFVEVGSELWFSARVPGGTLDRRALFRTDGTPAGTVEISLPPGTEGQTAYSSAAALGTGLVFVGCDGAAGCEPWFTDGVTATRIADLRPGPESSIGLIVTFDRPLMTSLGDQVLFLAEDQPGVLRLWRTDGTAGGTEALSDLGAPPPGFSFGYYPALVPPTVAGARKLQSLFRPDVGLEIWSSDGSVGGTGRIATLADLPPAALHPIHDLPSPGRSDCLSPLRQGVVLKAVGLVSAPEAHLAFSDGVPGGVETLAQLDELGFGTQVECESNGTEVLAWGSTSAQTGVWRTRGTVTSTELLLPYVTGFSTPLFERFGTHLLLAASYPPPLNQTQLFSIPRGASDPQQIAEVPLAITYGMLRAVEEKVFFGGNSALEVGDATSMSTLLLAPPDPPDPAFQVLDLTAAGQTLFFVYDTPEEGPELWRSDGSAAGTVVVRNLRPGPAGGIPEPELREIFRRPMEPRIAALGPDSVLFAADDGVSGTELWASDGTEAGTVLVADIDPGPDGSWPRHLVSAGPVAYFAAEHPTLGLELWRSDGTASGTFLVRDLVPGAGSSVPEELTVQDGVLYFSAWTPEHGREAWRSDGTFAGTYRLTDVAPGPLSSSPDRFVRRGHRLFFLATDHVHGFELWARADDGSIPIFIDGVETEDTSRWSAAVP